MSRAPGSEVTVVLSKVLRNLCGPPRGRKERVDHKVLLLWTKRPKAPPVRCEAMAEAQVSVAVLGAAGTIAPAIVHDLGESGEVAQHGLLDLDPARRPRSPTSTATARPPPRGSTRATSTRSPARSPAPAQRAPEHRVLPDRPRRDARLPEGRMPLPRPRRPVLGHRRQLELGAEFERAGRLAVLGIGSSPGKTNLMAAEACAELDAEAGSNRSTSSPPAATRRRRPTDGSVPRTRSRR